MPDISRSSRVRQHWQPWPRHIDDPEPRPEPPTQGELLDLADHKKALERFNGKMPAGIETIAHRSLAFDIFARARKQDPRSVRFTTKPKYARRKASASRTAVVRPPALEDEVHERNRRTVRSA